jgi:hypothetical protein
MELEHRYAYDKSEARERVRALGDYLQNRHGMQVQWLDDDRAHIKGKYTVVGIDAQVIVEDGMVRVSGKDPGMLFRAPAKKYVAGKLEKYLDPQQVSAELPRK